MEEKKEKVFLLYSVLKSLLSALVITGLSLLVISVIYLNRDLTDTLARNLVTASALLSVFLSAAVSGVKMKRKGLIMGLLSGAAYALCLYITGFLAFGILKFSKSLVSTLTLCIISGALGGIAGVNLRRKG